MARPSKYDWNEIKNAYECGIVVNDLVSKYGVTKKTLQNRISNELWEVTGSIKNDIDEVSSSLGKITGTIAQNPTKAHIISMEILTSINDTVKQLDARELITNATKINLTRTMEHLANNKKLEKINIGDGIQNFEEVGLGSIDYKQLQDTIDKASLTLGINQRHAPKTEINNNNATQNNTNLKVEFE